MKKLIFILTVLLFLVSSVFGIIVNFNRVPGGPPTRYDIEVLHDGEPPTPITDFHFSITPASCQIVAAEPPPGWALRYALPNSFVEMDATIPDAAIIPGGLAVFGITIDGECEDAYYTFYLTGPDGVIPGTEQEGPLGGLSIDEKPTPAALDINIYPNPFNSVVRIVFVGVLHETLLQVKIYDIHGKLVSKSYETEKQIGKNACLYSWEPDELVGSGIYLVRASYGGNTVLKRIVYLK